MGGWSSPLGGQGALPVGDLSGRVAHLDRQPRLLVRPLGDTRSARGLNAAVHTLTHPSAKLSRPEAAKAYDGNNIEATTEPAAAPRVPDEQAAESLFAALAAEADEETAGA